MFGWFRCLIGLHPWRSNHWEREEPHPRGFPIVAETYDKVWCRRCGHVMYEQHLVWTGNEFVDAE